MAKETGLERLQRERREHYNNVEDLQYRQLKQQQAYQQAMRDQSARGQYKTWIQTPDGKKYLVWRSQAEAYLKSFYATERKFQKAFEADSHGVRQIITGWNQTIQSAGKPALLSLRFLISFAISVGVVIVPALFAALFMSGTERALIVFYAILGLIFVSLPLFILLWVIFFAQRHGFLLNRLSKVLSENGVPPEQHQGWMNYHLDLYDHYFQIPAGKDRKKWLAESMFNDNGFDFKLKKFVFSGDNQASRVQHLLNNEHFELPTSFLKLYPAPLRPLNQNFIGDNVRRCAEEYARIYGQTVRYQ